jgi:hypothetical protein
VTFWTAHLANDREPVVLREGFSWGALLFGPFWLLLHRAWIPAALSFAAFVLVGALLRDPFQDVVTLGLMLLLGLTGNDLLAWSLERRGFLLAHVITARTEADALARLLINRPDLVTRMAQP